MYCWFFFRILPTHVWLGKMDSNSLWQISVCKVIDKVQLSAFSLFSLKLCMLTELMEMNILNQTFLNLWPLTMLELWKNIPNIEKRCHHHKTADTIPKVPDHTKAISKWDRLTNWVAGPRITQISQKNGNHGFYNIECVQFHTLCNYLVCSSQLTIKLKQTVKIKKKWYQGLDKNNKYFNPAHCLNTVGALKYQFFPKFCMVELIAPLAFLFGLRL